MKHFVTGICLLLVFAATAQTPSIKKSPPLSEAKPESVGMSAQRLARLDSMCLQAVAKNEVPGMVALVARHGKIVYYKAFGMADNAAGRLMKRDDIFRIASQTKAITATAVMMLWEEGKFSLDDPISNFIPEFKNPQVLKTFQYSDTTYTTEAAKGEITIRQLLTHTSGLGYGVIDGDERFKMIYRKAGVTDLFTTDTISIGESVKKLARLPLHHQPGEKFTYSEGLDVMGYLVEIVSGMPFDQFLKTRIFDPLGMKDTWFYLPDDKAARLVPVQRSEQGTWAHYPLTFYDPAYPVSGARRFFSGGAGLSSTVLDYANFLQMYLNGGELNGVRILSRTTIQSMMGNQTKDLMGDPGSFYALAFSVLTPAGQDVGGRSSAGTFGWGGYFNTSYFADPKEGVIGILFKQTQQTYSDGTGRRFQVLVGQSIDD
jgi:CubicO group peptidase (beta-lactamase class C family)